MSRTSRWSLFFEWMDLRFPRLTRFLITILLLGAYAPTPALIAKTQETFSRRLKRPVSAEEAKEIIRAFSNFVTVLKEVRRGSK